MLIQSMNFNMDVSGQFSVLLILSVVGLLLNRGGHDDPQARALLGSIREGAHRPGKGQRVTRAPER